MSDAASRVLAAIGPEFPDEPPPPNFDEGARGKRPQASLLVALALERYRLGRATTGEPFAYNPVFSPVVRMLRGGRDSLRAELAARFAEQYDRAPSASALADAMLVLEGRAQREPATALALRVAQHDGDLFIDLGNEQCDVVIVSAAGWRLAGVEPLPVSFRRTELTGPLPLPVSGGQLDELRQFLNVTADAWPLIVGWLVAALLPDVPQPVLRVDGEQGSGKTTNARTVVNLIDPSSAPLRSSPKDPEEWAVVASGSWVVGIDNVSSITTWLSDAICRAVTGDGLVRRRLYSDSELTVLAIRRAVILTSIDAGAIRGDLADRLLVVELERIEPHRRRQDAFLSRAFDEAHPRLFGALLDTVARVLAVLPSVHLETLPRMADFARVLAAVDIVLDTKALSTYLALGERLAAEVVDGDAVAAAVRRFVERCEGQAWSGTTRDLLTAIEPEHRPKGWPADATRLGGRLKRAAPALRSVGVNVVTRRAKAGVVVDLSMGVAEAPKGVAEVKLGPLATPSATPVFEGICPDESAEARKGVAGVAESPVTPAYEVGRKEGERGTDGVGRQTATPATPATPRDDEPWRPGAKDAADDDPWGESS